MTEHTISKDTMAAGGGSHRSMHAGSNATLEHLMKVGELVYIDSMAGLVPARIVEIEGAVGNHDASRLDHIFKGRITVVTTGARPGYKRGERISCLPSAVVARRAIHRRNGQFRITQLNYAYEVGP